MGDGGERRFARTRGDTMETTSGGGAKAALLALMVFVAAIAVALAGGSSTAGASELETFASCEELDDWMQSSQGAARTLPTRSEEHTSELQSLMRISYAVFCLKKKNNQNMKHYYTYDRKPQHITINNTHGDKRPSNN